MKSGVASILSFLFCFSLSWASTVSHNNMFLCDVDVKTVRIEQQLLASTWATSLNLTKDRYIFQFNHDGSGHLVRYDYPTGRDYERYQWQLVSEDNMITLVLEYPVEEGAVSILEVEATGKELLLKDLSTGQNFRLRFPVAKATGQLDKIRAGLVGKWENATYAIQSHSESGIPVSNDVSLGFHFQNDGKYERVIGNNVREKKESGTWELSKDGDYIFFKPMGSPATSYMVKIKYLEGDELVLEQNQPKSKKPNSRKIRDYFFNKI